MNLNTIIKHNDFVKNLNINWRQNVGDIEEIILKTCNLMIYNVEYMCLDISEQKIKIILGSEVAKFGNHIDPKILEGVTNPLQITVLDRERDEHGNVRPNNQYIQLYNNFQQEKIDLELARNMQDEFNYQRHVQGGQPSMTEVHTLLSALATIPVDADEDSNEESNENESSNEESNQDESSNEDSNEDESSNEESVEPHISGVNFSLEQINQFIEFLNYVRNSIHGQAEMESHISAQAHAQAPAPAPAPAPTSAPTSAPAPVPASAPVSASAPAQNLIQASVQVLAQALAQAQESVEDEDDYDDLPPLEDINNNTFFQQTTQQIQNVINTLQTATGNNVNNGYITLSGLGELTNFMQTFVYTMPASGQYMSTTQLNNLTQLLGEDIKVTLTPQELNKQLVYSFKDYVKTTNYQNNQFKSETCNICLEPFQDTDQIMVLTNCQHYYHKSCINKWLTEDSNKCPVCRVEVAPGKPNIPNNAQEVENAQEAENDSGSD